MRVGRGARWMAEGKARLGLLSIGLAFDTRASCHSSCQDNRGLCTLPHMIHPAMWMSRPPDSVVIAELRLAILTLLGD
jgi:hypothetical protein